MLHLRNARLSVPLLAASLLMLGSAACKSNVDYFCDEDTPCAERYPDRSFCDLTGAYPASEGIGQTCIAPPFDAGPVVPDRIDAGGPCDTSTHACIEAAPAPWSGPVIRWDAASGTTRPACTPDFPTTLGDYGYNFVAGGACDCDCGPASGMSCAGDAIVNHYVAPRCLSQIASQSISPGTCVAAEADMDQGGFYDFNEPGIVGGSCVVETINGLTTPEFSNHSRVCAGADLGGTCASDGDVCAPKATGDYEGQMCIYISGETGCPADSPYSEQHIYYSDFDDTRSCGGCSCGSPTGSCGTVRLSTSSSCAGGASNATLAPAACVEFTLTHIGFFNSDMSGSCANSEGVMSGNASATEPVTLCCTP